MTLVPENPSMYIWVKRGVWIKVFGCKRNLENANRQDFELPTWGHCDWCVMQGNLGLRNLSAKTNFTFQNTVKEFFKETKKKDLVQNQGWIKLSDPQKHHHLSLGTQVPFSYPRDKGKLQLHLDPTLRGWCGSCTKFLCPTATLLRTLWLNFMDEFYAIESQPGSVERLFAQP